MTNNPRPGVASRVRLFRAATITVLAIGALAGCATEPAPALDPAQARTDLYEQLDAAQELVGGEWGGYDDSSPEPCTRGGEDGVTFTGNRLSNDAAGAETLAAVEELWNGMGFDAVVQQTVGPYVTVVATSPTDPENVLRFGLAENAMYLEGTGACGEGDLYDWVMKVREESGQ
jgi:hypothetical protein